MAFWSMRRRPCGEQWNTSWYPGLVVTDCQWKAFQSAPKRTPVKAVLGCLSDRAPPPPKGTHLQQKVTWLGPPSDPVPEVGGTPRSNRKFHSAEESDLEFDANQVWSPRSGDLGGVWGVGGMSKRCDGYSQRPGQECVQPTGTQEVCVRHNEGRTFGGRRKTVCDHAGKNGAGFPGAPRCRRVHDGKRERLTS